MKEVEDVISEIRNASSTEIEIIHGTGFNLELNGEVVVTVIATGFDTINKTETENIVKEEEVNRSYQTTHNTYNYTRPQQETVARTPYVESGSTKNDAKETKETKVPSWLQNRFK
jgi:cell division protein ftsZ